MSSTAGKPRGLIELLERARKYPSQIAAAGERKSRVTLVKRGGSTQGCHPQQGRASSARLVKHPQICSENLSVDQRGVEAHMQAGTTCIISGAQHGRLISQCNICTDHRSVEKMAIRR